jgi:hypothetical protein
MMKTFILHSTLFSLCLLITLVVILFLTNTIISQRASFKIADSVKYIIIGHSHPECAFNDSLIDNCSNFSQSGESYFYNYFKIRQLLKSNSQIEAVFIEYTNNLINKEMDEWIWGERYMSVRYPKYAPFMDNKDLFVLLSHNFKDFVNDQKLLFKKNLHRIIDGKYNYIRWRELGRYNYLIRDKTDSLVAAMANRSTGNISQTNVEISEINIFYLEKIVQVCRSHNVKVFFIRSPLHKLYQGISNRKKFKEIRTTRFARVEYIDFKNYPLLDSEFGDFEHLNYRGAKKFSIFFNQLIKSGMLQQENKQKFVMERINVPG